MLDAVFNVLLERVVTAIQDEANHMQEFPEQLKKLKDEILFMKSYLKDVDKVKVKDQNETLKTSVQGLRELLYDVEDIIADCELMFLKQQQRQGIYYNTYSFPSYLKFRYQMGKKLVQKNKEIKSFRKKMISYLGTTLNFPKDKHVVGGSQSARYPILINEAEIVGLDDDAKKVIEWVMQEDGSLKIIGIVGMGGIGKTTLAEKIYNNHIVRGHFDHALMVTVSQSFELKEIVKDILRKLKTKEDNPIKYKRQLIEEDERGLLEGLRDQLKGKYLLIFDDIWETNGGLRWWESLKSAFPQRYNGSCVLVTTRQERVAISMGALKKHIHHLQLLSIESSWSLFTKIAFAKEGENCPDPELEKIGKAIVTKCGGLPLAIKVVGGIMLGKGHSVVDWRWIYEHLKEEVHKTDDLVISTLQLSYQELPMHLKPCLLCFASFREDSLIIYWDMINWWIGEGLVQGRDGKTARQIGQECLVELVSRGLLLGVHKYFSEEKFLSFRVHDMIREMIIEIAKDENFINLVRSDNSSSCVQSRRVVLRADAIDGFFNKADQKLLQLRTLIAEEIIESKMSLSKLYPLKWLRVLNLSFSETEDDDHHEKQHHWLDGIGSFQHLINLQIYNSRMESLPESIKSLRSLQILSFRCCPHLKRFPRQLTSLEKLTIMGIWECNSLEYFPKGMGNLSNLEEFEIVPARSEVTEGCRLSEMKKLTQLRELSIYIKSGDHLEDEELHVLPELKQLKKVIVKIVEGSKTDEHKKQLLKKVDYKLPPCQQLQELHLYRFPGKETPVWLNPTTFPNLRFLRISEGNIAHMCPEFFGKSDQDNKVWRLEVLDLFEIEELEEEWPSMHRAMPYLRLLIVTGCPKLKSFPCDVEKHGTWRKDDHLSQAEIVPL